MVSREADGEEASFEAGLVPYPLFNFFIGIATLTTGVSPNVAVLTICDEHDCQFFQVRVILKKHLNPLKDTHEVRTTASSDAIDLAIVAGL